MPALQEFVMPGLATVTIDTENDFEPLLRIVLDTTYDGDLNDLEKDNGFAPGVYLECDSTSCINDPLLAKFMEVLSHWDHDHDGQFDGDALREAIDNAMWRSHDLPDEFHRPGGNWFVALLMKLMPPAPARHIVFSFGELRERFRWQHYVIAIPAIAAIIGLIQLQIHLVPVLQYNVITGLMRIGNVIGINGYLALGLGFGLFMLLNQIFAGIIHEKISRSPHTYGFFNSYAVLEEQGFREGAEDWNLRQRITSCLVFGAVHMTNLIYPLATILPLALGGAIFMAVYLRVYRRTKFRRSAVLAAALVHRVYNRIALAAFVISLVILLGWTALGMFGIAALLMLMTVVRPDVRPEFSRKVYAPAAD